MNFKKFLYATLAVTFFVANIFLSPIVNAETLTEEQLNSQVEEYIATLPTTTKTYKSQRRPILIQGAMPSEVGKLIKALENPVVYWHMHYLFVTGKYKNYPVVVSRTEIGMENAAAATVLAIEKFNPVLVINQGTAGGYLPDLHLKNIVIADKSINCGTYKEDYSPSGEYDITKQHLCGIPAYDKNSKGATQFVRTLEFKSDEKLLKVAETVAKLNQNWNVRLGTIGSSNGWNSAIDHIIFLRDNYGVVCEEMETNAVAQMCYTAEIPFIGMRVISNNIVNGEQFDISTALSCQDFVLLVVEKYISSVLKK